VLVGAIRFDDDYDEEDTTRNKHDITLISMRMMAI